MKIIFVKDNGTSLDDYLEEIEQGKLNDCFPALTDDEGEVRELTKEDFMAMRPMEEVLSKDLVEIIKKCNG